MGILSFFGACKQENSNSNGDKLTSELKFQLRSELKSHPDKEFDTEFIRNTDLEHNIISTYGFDGVKLLFEARNTSSYYPLGEFPKNCPWSVLNDKSVSDFITANFRSISNKITTLVSALGERCRLIYAEKKDDTWQLHYLLDMKLYDDRDYFAIYTRGAPLYIQRPITI